MALVVKSNSKTLMPTFIRLLHICWSTQVQLVKVYLMLDRVYLFDVLDMPSTQVVKVGHTSVRAVGLSSSISTSWFAVASCNPC